MVINCNCCSGRCDEYCRGSRCKPSRKPSHQRDSFNDRHFHQRDDNRRAHKQAGYRRRGYTSSYKPLKQKTRQRASQWQHDYESRLNDNIEPIVVRHQSFIADNNTRNGEGSNYETRYDGADTHGRYSNQKQSVHQKDAAAATDKRSDVRDQPVAARKSTVDADTYPVQPAVHEKHEPSKVEVGTMPSKQKKTEISTQYDIPRQHPAPEIRGIAELYNGYHSW